MPIRRRGYRPVSRLYIETPLFKDVRSRSHDLFTHIAVKTLAVNVELTHNRQRE